MLENLRDWIYNPHNFQGLLGVSALVFLLIIFSAESSSERWRRFFYCLAAVGVVFFLYTFFKSF